MAAGSIKRDTLYNIILFKSVNALFAGLVPDNLIGKYGYKDLS